MRGKWDVACRGSPHSVQFYAEWDDAASRLPRTVRICTMWKRHARLTRGGKCAPGIRQLDVHPAVRELTHHALQRPGGVGVDAA